MKTRVRHSRLPESTMVGSIERYKTMSYLPDPIWNLVSVSGQDRKYTPYQQVTEDVSDPGFRKRRRHRELVVNPFMTRKTEQVYSPAFSSGNSELVSYSRWGRKIVPFYLYRYWGVDPLSHPYAEARMGYSQIGFDADRLANARLSAEVKQRSPDFDYALALAEGRESLALIRDMLHGVMNPIKTMKRRLRKAGVRKGTPLTPEFWDNATGDVADIYLAFQFGIKPIFNDLVAYQGYIKPDKLAFRQTYRGGDSPYLDKDEETWKHPNGTDETIFRSSLTQKYTSGITADYAFDNIQDVINASLGWHKPIGTLYELVPWSFLFDYFVNIGEMVRTLDQPVGVTNQAGWVTVRSVRSRTVTRKLTHLYNDRDMNLKSKIFSSTTSIVDKQVQRFKLDNIELRPTFTLDLDTHQLANICALIRSRLSYS